MHMPPSQKEQPGWHRAPRLLNQGFQYLWEQRVDSSPGSNGVWSLTLDKWTFSVYEYSSDAEQFCAKGDCAGRTGGSSARIAWGTRFWSADKGLEEGSGGAVRLEARTDVIVAEQNSLTWYRDWR
ncbi:predicted protein [Aspergillus nidulans FGSC A4]|uniref:Uncharacterized protein n=1 Tax=Emericella nidulans (strain FGSC A4 / ATCC 38163 / CBS 112.46 / NRRL 194 / M139) TaxID=227321 RepID=Q5ART9_EMENI|nr:hypothetical protein [Aspergillus nidulans FGSC A4]EAA64323.1 predicted protein [Aspergillus nidulans FGSC A4]CBF84504.1 TPA: conserved hypothetical protein [Aspergillus nidulans FGSC A4]|eukprot:XP_682260.1 predicted protein [Aspergillus nidulans FGSC A4]